MSSSTENIYWSTVCSNESVAWSFWANEITVKTHDPDFTLCFQYTILIGIPSFYMILGGMTYFCTLRKNKTQLRSMLTSKFNIFKTITGVLMALIMLVDFFRTIDDAKNNSSTPMILYIYPIIMCISMVLAACLMHLEYRKGIHSSSFISAFWWLMLLIGIVILRSKIRYASLNLPEKDGFRQVTWIIFFILLVTQFFGSLVADLGVFAEFLHQSSTERHSEHVPLLSQEKSQSKVVQNQSVEDIRKISPEYFASFISWLTFSWIMPFMARGYKKALEFKDLYRLLPRDYSRPLVLAMKLQWDKQKLKLHETSSISQSTNHYQRMDESRETPSSPHGFTKSKQKTNSLMIPFFKVGGKNFFISGFLRLLYDVVSFILPMLLELFITFIQTRDPYQWHGYLIIVLLFITSMLRTILWQHYGRYGTIVGMHLRTAVIGLVYRKAIKLSGSARKNTTIGEIVNLMSVDAQKILEAPVFLHYLWISPIIIIFAIYLLWMQLGASVMAGLVVMVLLIPINAYFASKVKNLQIEQMKYKDKRIKLMNEILNGIKVLKLYAWEPSFEAQVNEIRRKELLVIRKSAFLNAFSAITWFCSPFLISLSTFAVFVLSDPSHILDANKTFVSLSLFNILNFPLSMLPSAITYAIQAYVATKRIEKFLNLDDINPYVIENNDDDNSDIEIKDASFSWEKGGNEVLKNINFSAKKGSLVAIVGQVGSGKTSFISALLGELFKTSGTVKRNAQISYVPQQAWCQNKSLRENITFGKSMDSTRYKEVLESCALKEDLKNLPAGDETEIGEKGINLSGGQKQRVSLARAIYQNKSVLLLDDPLSAVDSHVGKHIFDKVIGPKGIMAKKTRIFVTNNLTLLHQVNNIVVLKDGVITEMGSFDDLLDNNGAFAELCDNFLHENEHELDDENTDAETRKFTAELRRRISVLSGSEISDASFEMDSKKRKSRHPSIVHTLSSSMKKNSLLETQQVVQKSRLTTDETSETGGVSWTVFAKYAAEISWSMVFLTLITFVGYLANLVATNFWLSMWSQDASNNATEQDTNLRDFRLIIYGVFGGGQAIFVLFNNMFIAIGMVRASSSLHGLLLSNVIRTPIQFFDTTPLGRIMNRFSKDIDAIDTYIPLLFRFWLQMFAAFVATLLIICISIPIFTIVLIPLGLLYVIIQRFYIRTARQLKRIDSVRRSPIFSHFQESVVGSVTIRAYQKQDEFTDKSDTLIDESNMAWYLNMCANRWLGFYLEFLGNLVILLAGIFAVISTSTNSEYFNAGLAGLSVSYSLQITQSLNYMVRMTCDLETQIVSVERIKEYSEISHEAPWSRPERQPPRDWPSRGEVRFLSYSVRYRPELELVLHDINATVNSGEKVGIVGRTGAGKSSLTLALFRLLEPASGTIFVDGYDIASLGLHDLRSRITIIPQDPILFSGSLRLNVDPFEHFSDAQVWTVLEQSYLKEFVESQPEGLLFKCSEGGDNLSVGQRQLICLARALLRKSKILVLDEATAAVDLETDEIIQATIRRQFRDSTVLTIAHRLNTIMDYDKILVLDKGQVKEFDSPKVLLSDNGSEFYSMARDAGLV